MNNTKKILYIDMDDVICNYSKLHASKLASNPELKFPQAEYGFFLELEPIEMAIESIKYLENYYEIYFLTAPSFQNPMCYAEKNYWIRKYFGMEYCKKLIICYDKSLLKGDYLIDDSTKNNQLNFEGELIKYDTQDKRMWYKITDKL